METQTEAPRASEPAAKAPERVAPKRAQEPGHDERVDQLARNMFEHLGYKGRLPDLLVETYNDFKRVKDKVRTGSLSAEGYAFVVAIFKLKERL